MREVIEVIRACRACGAPASDYNAGGALYGDDPGGVFVRGACAPSPSRATRERSGLAHAAGFAGVAYLFQYSLAPLASVDWGLARTFASGLFLLWSLLAPAALALSYAAALSLDRSPEKAGRLPALFGFSVGLCGTVHWLFVLGELLRHAAAASY
jgi:hypothetical protein